MQVWCCQKGLSDLERPEVQAIQNCRKGMGAMGTACKHSNRKENADARQQLKDV